MATQVYFVFGLELIQIGQFELLIAVALAAKQISVGHGPVGRRGAIVLFGRLLSVRLHFRYLFVVIAILSSI